MKKACKIIKWSKKNSLEHFSLNSLKHCFIFFSKKASPMLNGPKNSLELLKNDLYHRFMLNGHKNSLELLKNDLYHRCQLSFLDFREFQVDGI
jgi:hypothetical protein